VRECHAQLPLINLLCDYGADPTSAIHAALHGGSEAVSALIRRGANIDFPVSAALGNVDDARRLLPAAASRDRHLAFALASQFGHAEIVRLLLDAGKDPNRYNPVGYHSHSMPLHQAAAAGQLEVVRLLVERGAKLDLKDALWLGTPADWAKQGGRKEVEVFLLAQDSSNKYR
jgi:ankyrin repeat protein